MQWMKFARGICISLNFLLVVDFSMMIFSTDRKQSFAESYLSGLTQIK